MPFDVATIRAALDDGTIHGDGHTIYFPSAYEPHFTEDELQPIVQSFESDTSSHKSTIFKDGQVVAEVTGIYNLVFLQWLKGRLGIARYSTAGGRGSAARDYVRFIQEWADEQPA